MKTIILLTLLLSFTCFAQKVTVINTYSEDGFTNANVITYEAGEQPDLKQYYFYYNEDNSGVVDYIILDEISEDSEDQEDYEYEVFYIYNEDEESEDDNKK